MSVNLKTDVYAKGSDRLLARGLLFLLLFLPFQLYGADNKVRVFVSVLPQKTFVERIGGDAVDVSVMVKPGFSPATYEPTPRQIVALSKAGLYIRIGVPFEQAWMPRIRSVNPDMVLLDAREGLALRDLEEHHHGHDDHDDHETEAHDAENETDPHLWTSPLLVMQMAEQIRDQLIALKPADKALFTENHAAFINELEALDQEFKALFSEAEGKTFLVFHPSWGYFADAYGLTQVAIESEGKEPGARALAALIKQAKQNEAKTIFVQPQFDQRAAKQVAKAIDGKVVAIDPLAADYFVNMRRAARLIAGVSAE
ncbi:MAG: metal ABC transporter solute-binding protein, Zn/Mn family [Thiolinea sp.]